MSGRTGRGARAALATALAAAALCCTSKSSSNGGTAPPPPPPPPPPSLSAPSAIYPTRAGGREWTLPANAEVSGAEWVPGPVTTTVTQGVFHTDGSTSSSVLGEVRMTVHSPAGAAWWRNVEITAYFRQTSAIATPGQVAHWELLVRGERHSGNDFLFSALNDGVAAPAGTATWPWYPLASGTTVNAACVGNAYHGNVYPTGRVHFEKEITHTDGYAQAARADATQTDLYVPGFAPGIGTVFGVKFVVRNANAGASVHLELWIDAAATDSWTKVAQVDDVATNPWVARTTTMNGCVSAPYSYSTSEIMTWAGPWVTFRSDGMGMDFGQLSIREIDPL